MFAQKLIRIDSIFNQEIEGANEEKVVDLYLIG
jgi:hypothetical protein